MTRVLVAFGSKRGSTAELAEWIGADLRSTGVDADVRDADDVTDLSGYDAVVLGGALYMARWARPARRFARRHAAALRDRPVWLFSSGPLDDSADTKDIAPVKRVAAIADQTEARGHVTFGGALSPEARGFPASAMAKKVAGDYRNRERVRDWANGVATTLGQPAMS
jgi:menaquinone-dependent protoporphyrinogen oxidase